MMVTMGIAIGSVIFNFLIVPIILPTLYHSEEISFLIMHSFNKLPYKFIENEIVCCSNLLNYVGAKVKVS